MSKLQKNLTKFCYFTFILMILLNFGYICYTKNLAEKSFLFDYFGSCGNLNPTISAVSLTLRSPLPLYSRWISLNFRKLCK